MPIKLPAALLALATSALPGQGSVSPYATGTAGQGGFVPRAWISGSPHVGNAQLALTVDRGRVGTAAAALLSPGPATIPIAGITLLVDPFVWLIASPSMLLGGGAFGTPGLGTATLPLPVPPDPNLEGFSLYTQWIALDPGAAGGISASDGVRITVTRGPLVIGSGLSTFEAYSHPAGPVHTLTSGGDTYGCAFNRDGSLGFAIYSFAPPATGLEVYDTRSLPPVKLAVGPLGGRAQALAIHPNDERAYVVYASNTLGAIGYHDIKRGSATLGQRLGHVSGVSAPAQLSKVVYADISRDGRRLAVSAFDLFAAIRTLILIDVDPGSPTRDQVLKEYRYTAQQMLVWGGIALTANGRYAFVAGMDNNTGRLAQLDLQNGAFVRSVVFTGSPDHIVLDPRERFVAMTASSSTQAQVAIVSLEPGAGFFVPTYIITAPALLGPVALSADGSTVLGADWTSGGFAAFDVATGNPLWSVASAATTLLCAVR